MLHTAPWPNGCECFADAIISPLKFFLSYNYCHISILQPYHKTVLLLEKSAEHVCLAVIFHEAKPKGVALNVMLVQGIPEKFGIGNMVGCMRVFLSLSFV